MPTVYRIEGPSGYGAFTEDYRIRCQAPADIHDAEVPGDLHRSSYDGPSALAEHRSGNSTIYNALNCYTHSKLRFCCTSLDQLREWFFNQSGCQKMSELGCKLVTYEVPDEFLFVGIQQAVFLASKAEVVSRECPSVLHTQRNAA